MPCAQHGPRRLAGARHTCTTRTPCPVGAISPEARRDHSLVPLGGTRLVELRVSLVRTGIAWAGLLDGTCNSCVARARRQAPGARPPSRDLSRTFGLYRPLVRRPRRSTSSASRPIVPLPRRISSVAFSLLLRCALSDCRRRTRGRGVAVVQARARKAASAEGHGTAPQLRARRRPRSAKAVFSLPLPCISSSCLACLRLRSSFFAHPNLRSLT